MSRRVVGLSPIKQHLHRLPLELLGKPPPPTRGTLSVRLRHRIVLPFKNRELDFPDKPNRRKAP
jgi:hypothetical protein